MYIVLESDLPRRSVRPAGFRWAPQPLLIIIRDRLSETRPLFAHAQDTTGLELAQHHHDHGVGDKQQH